jgi:hypothetical protein
MRESEPERQAAKSGESEATMTRMPLPSSRPQPTTGFRRTVGAIRTVLPILQKILPLLDGNVVSVVSNLLAPSLLAPRVNLEPVEAALARLHTEIQEFTDKTAKHNLELKRIEEQLELVKDAAERNALEQRELSQDLADLRKGVRLLAWIGLGLVAVSIAVSVVLFIRMQPVQH